MVCIGKIVSRNGVKVFNSSVRTHNLASAPNISMFVPLSSIVETEIIQFQDEQSSSQKTLYLYTLKKYDGSIDKITAEQKAYGCDESSYIAPALMT